MSGLEAENWDVGDLVTPGSQDADITRPSQQQTTSDSASAGSDSDKGDGRQDDTLSVAPTRNPETRRYLREETVRGILALSTLLLFALTGAAAFCVVVFDLGEWEDTKDLLDVLIPVETLLLGGAVSFYYATTPSRR